MKAGLFVVLTLCAALGGCASPTGTQTPSGTDTRFDLPAGAPGAADGPRTLDDPPEWRLGEWWLLEIWDRFTGTTRDVTLVVTGVEGDHYLIAMPSAAFDDSLFVFHAPGFGRVEVENFSYEVHDAWFQPVQFPLRDGETWTTRFMDANLDATVTRESPTRAQIAFAPSAGTTVETWRFRLVYDTTLGYFATFEGDATGTPAFRITTKDHGYEYQGAVLAPLDFRIFASWRNQGLTGNHVECGGANPVNQPQASGTDSFDMPAGFDRASIDIMIGNTLRPDVAHSGYYSHRVVAPDGTTFEETLLPGDDRGLIVGAHSHGPVEGRWTFTSTVIGPGGAVSENFAYRVLEVELPEARVTREPSPKGPC